MYTGVQYCTGTSRSTVGADESVWSVFQVCQCMTVCCTVIVCPVLLTLCLCIAEVRRSSRNLGCLAQHRQRCCCCSAWQEVLQRFVPKRCDIPSSTQPCAQQKQTRRPRGMVSTGACTHTLACMHTLFSLSLSVNISNTHTHTFVSCAHALILVLSHMDSPSTL